jgi:hypothetical protein
VSGRRPLTYSDRGVRIPPGAWIFVCCECRVLSGRGLCDELITRPEESYRLYCVVVCDLETSRIGTPYIYDISHLRVNIICVIQCVSGNALQLTPRNKILLWKPIPVQLTRNFLAAVCKPNTRPLLHHSRSPNHIGFLVTCFLNDHYPPPVSLKDALFTSG